MVDSGIGVPILEYVAAIVTELDRRLTQKVDDADRRYQQRYEQSEKALAAALAAAKEAVQVAMVAAEKATNKAEAASDKRFSAVNEFRGQLSDQAALFIPRAEAEARMQALQDKVEDLKTSRDTSAGKGVGQTQLWGFVVGGVGFLTAVVSLFVVFSKLGG